MRYSQGDGVHTPLSKLVLHPRFSVYASVIGVIYTFVFSCVIVVVFVCVDYSRHDHVLYGTIIIKTMCVHERYLQG